MPWSPLYTLTKDIDNFFQLGYYPIIISTKQGSKDRSCTYVILIRKIIANTEMGLGRGPTLAGIISCLIYPCPPASTSILAHTTVLKVRENYTSLHRSEYFSKN